MEDNVQKVGSDENLEETLDITAHGTDEQPDNNNSGIDQEVIQQLKSNQNLIGAVLGGFLGAAAGAALWAIVTATTKYQIGYMALGVGFLAGFMVRKLGHGFEKPFGYIGAVWSLLGCFAGNILATLIMISNQESIPLIAILPLLRVDIIIDIAKETFSLMDLLFYGIAIYEGYRFSFITESEINMKLNELTK